MTESASTMTADEIKAELRHALRFLDNAVEVWDYPTAVNIHGHVQELLEDLWRVLPKAAAG